MLLNMLAMNQKERSKLEKLYLLYKKEMYYTAYNILKDHHEAQDIVQAAIVNVSRQLDRFEDINSNKSRILLIIIVRNLSYNTYNKRKKIKK